MALGEREGRRSRGGARGRFRRGQHGFGGFGGLQLSMWSRGLGLRVSGPGKHLRGNKFRAGVLLAYSPPAPESAPTPLGPVPTWSSSSRPRLDEPDGASGRASQLTPLLCSGGGGAAGRQLCGWRGGGRQCA